MSDWLGNESTEQGKARGSARSGLSMASKRITEWEELWNRAQVNRFEKSLELVLFLIFCFIKKKTRQSARLGKRRYFKFHCLNIFSENKLPQPFGSQKSGMLFLSPSPPWPLIWRAHFITGPCTYLTARRWWIAVCGSCWLWMTCNGGCWAYPVL